MNEISRAPALSDAIAGTVPTQPALDLSTIKKIIQSPDVRSIGGWNTIIAGRPEVVSACLFDMMKQKVANVGMHDPSISCEPVSGHFFLYSHLRVYTVLQSTATYYGRHDKIYESRVYHCSH